MGAAVAVPLISAGIGAIGALGGAKMNSSASKDAVRMQTSAADKALAEQKRIFDLQYEQEQKDRESRRQSRSQFDFNRASNASRLAPAYGEDQAQADARRMNSFGQPQGRPQQAPQGLPPTPASMSSQWPAGDAVKPPTPQEDPSQSMASTVWLQAPTGETMEVSLEQAPALIQKGAVLIPAPTGQMGRG
jgi:hypothetical protein